MTRIGENAELGKGMGGKRIGWEKEGPGLKPKPERLWKTSGFQQPTPLRFSYSLATYSLANPLLPSVLSVKSVVNPLRLRGFAS